MKKELSSSDYPDLREIDKFFEQYRKEYSEEIIRARAKEDAEKNIPRAELVEASPYEKELLHAASKLASKVVSKFTTSLELLDAKIKTELEYVEKGTVHSQENIETMFGIENDAAENAYGLAAAHKQLEVTEQRYNALYEKHGRGPVAYIPHWLYVVLAILIFLGEIPLNALVFEIFGENQVMTWIMAFIIGLSVPLVAHFVGIMAREHGNGFSLANALKGLATFSVVVIALWGLSEMRTTYLGANKVELGLSDQLVQTSFMFFWLNVAVFCAAIVVAYLSHDSVPGFLEAKHEFERARKAVAKAEKSRVKVLRKAGKRRADGLHKANSHERDGMIKVNMMKGVFDQILMEGREYESRCLSTLKKNISIYRHENLRHREGDVTPKSFETTIDFPLKLIRMPEKLAVPSSEPPEGKNV